MIAHSIVQNECTSEFAGRPARDLQLYAALCLEIYCKWKGFSHPSIDQLIKHLNDYPLNNELPAWERRGASLSLNGRGDEIPHDLVALISPKSIDEFSAVVESVVEVGLMDMHGAATDLPFMFLNKVVSILRCNNIDLPPSVGK